MQLKVRRPGRHSNEAKQAAALLLDIASTNSVTMPAPVRIQSNNDKQVSNPPDPHSRCHPHCHQHPYTHEMVTDNDLLELVKSQV